jgi:hypothetical protein
LVCDANELLQGLLVGEKIDDFAKEAEAWTIQFCAGCERIKGVEFLALAST